MHFFIFLLSSFSRFFSSLGNFLLSSMSLTISTSLSTLSSFFVVAFCVVPCLLLSFPLLPLDSFLDCNTIEPASTTWRNFCVWRCGASGRCFGSRSPARKSQLLLQPTGSFPSCAPSSPVIANAFVSFSSSSFPRGVDVHPSGRLSSKRACNLEPWTSVAESARRCENIFGVSTYSAPTHSHETCFSSNY